MDNVTHSLVGYTLARLLPAKIAGEPGSARAKVTVLGAVLASNVPDGDFAFPPLFENSKLAYLLHHRGHTHTVVVAVVLGALVALLSERLVRQGRLAGRERRRSCGVGAAAALLHIVFDSFNNYGVHPFFPFDNRWYYGDFVFIVEPLLLATLLPALLVHRSSLAARVIGGALVSTLALLVWGVSAVPLGVALGTSIACVALMLACTLRGGSVAPGAIAAVCVLAAFAWGRWEAGSRLDAGVRALRGHRVLALSMTPMPGNPLCFQSLVAGVEGGTQYSVRRGAISLWPAWIPPEACAFRTDAASTATTTASREALGDGVITIDVFRAPLAELRDLHASHCEAAALLRFVRVPYWGHSSAGRVLGDLRYDFEPGLGFAELLLAENATRCPPLLPPWTPPLAAVLDTRR